MIDPIVQSIDRGPTYFPIMMQEDGLPRGGNRPSEFENFILKINPMVPSTTALAILAEGRFDESKSVSVLQASAVLPTQIWKCHQFFYSMTYVDVLLSKLTIHIEKVKLNRCFIEHFLQIEA